MSQTAITKAFEAWLVDRTVNGEPARPDKMVFALIAGQNENAEISRLEGMPTAAQIRYTTDITQYGALNKNAVVYSVVLDTSVGNWEYNWVGLIDSKTNTVLMIVHLPVQQKIKTDNGKQGNSLIRNIAMEFDAAAALSKITVTAQTWMIDFSARLRSMDESRRVSRIDYYGAAAFRDDGFLATASGNTVKIAPGLGYVAGLRVYLANGISLAANNTGVWVDVVWSGTVTGTWAYKFELRTGASLADYVDNAGFQHFVTKIATVTNGKVTDHRMPFPIQALDQALGDFYNKTKSDQRFLRGEENLSDVVSASASRKNLGVYSTNQVDDLIKGLMEQVETLKKACPHKVGDVVIKAADKSPALDYPGTTWVKLPPDVMLRTANAAASNILQVSGQDSVTLTGQEMPKHSHDLQAHESNTALDGGGSTRRTIDVGDQRTDSTVIKSAGEGKAFSVLNRHVAVVAWQRTA